MARSLKNNKKKLATRFAAANNFVFRADPLTELECSMCSRKFKRPAASRRQVCSAECKRERALRYGAAYRQMGRNGRDQVRAMFGGRMPTRDEILEMIRARRRQS